MHPEVPEEVNRLVARAELRRIPGKEFHKQKERLLIVDFLLQKRQDLNDSERDELIKLVLDDGDMKGVSNVIKESAKDSKSTWRITDWLLNKDSSTKELLNDATRAASRTNDSQFISSIDEIVEREPSLQDDVSDTLEKVYTHFRTTVDKIVSKAMPRVDDIQKRECTRQIRREAESHAEENKRRSRLELIRDINQAQAEASYAAF